MIILHDDATHAWHGMGLGVLPDWLSAKVIRELNGSYYFEGEYPVNGLNADSIQAGRVLQCDTGQRTKRQFFDIVKVTQKDDKRYRVYAEHVGYRLKKMVTKPSFQIIGNGQRALETILSSIQGDQPYRAWSDVARNALTDITIDKYPNVHSMLSVVLDKWGGEFEFDNFTIKLHTHMGRTRPTEIVYGKNLQAIDDSYSTETLYTHLKPFVKRGDQFFTLSGDGLIPFHKGERYTRQTILAMDFSSHFQEDSNIVDLNKEPAEKQSHTISYAKHDTVSRKDDKYGDGEGGAWESDGNKQAWRYDNGKYALKKWVRNDNKWYYIGSDGYMYRDEWLRDKDGKQYYLSSDGSMLMGWQNLNNRWHYFDTDGSYQSERKHDYNLDEGKLTKLAQEYIDQYNDTHSTFQTTLTYLDLAAAGEGAKEELELADNVVVRFLNHTIEGVMLKVVATDWNCLAERYNTVTIGSLASLSGGGSTGGGIGGSGNGHADAVAKIMDIVLPEITEMKGLIGRTGDGLNDVYFADNGDKPNEPKGGFKEGDLWWEKNGQYTRLWKWTGESWELVFDSEDPEKSLEKYKEAAEEFANTLREEIEKKIAESKDAATEELYRKFLDSLGKPDSEVSKLLKANTPIDEEKLEEAITEKIKPIEHKFDDMGIDDLKLKLDETSEIARINTDLIGGDGKTSYNKNRLQGEVDRVIPFKTDYIEVTHNGDGFVVGKSYVVSWEAVCVPYGHQNIHAVMLTGWVDTTGKLVLTPSDSVFPTIRQDIAKRDTVVPMVYYGRYRVQYTDNLHQSVNTVATVDDATDKIELKLSYKPVFDANLSDTAETIWAENPELILDGGGNE